VRRHARERTYLNLSKKWLLANRYADCPEDIGECTMQYHAGKFYVKRDLFGADLVARSIYSTIWVNSCVGNVAEHKRRLDKHPLARGNMHMILDWTPGRGGKSPVVRCYWREFESWMDDGPKEFRT
jgi:hypothetical protein